MTKNTSSRDSYGQRHVFVAARLRRRAARRRRIILILALLIILAVLGWFFYHYIVSGNSTAKAATPPTVEESVSKKAELKNESLASTPIDELKTLTPMIASYKKLTLRLPVKTEDLTEMALHQASYSYAKPLSTPLEIADPTQTAREHGTDRPLKQPHGVDAVFDGSILQLWRSGRSGKANTALDVGAKPKSPVLSPVDGTVTLVRHYKLYGKWDDVEVHIKPKGYPDLDVVLIHITEPRVSAGNPVTGGLTEIGNLRKLSDKEKLQLERYTAKKDGGNHTHIQVNDAKDPTYIERLNPKKSTDKAKKDATKTP